MNNKYSIARFIMIAIGVVIFSAVSWHSVDEIHYLKTFYPKQFTVQEAYYASIVELIKVLLIGMPIALIISACVYLLNRHSKEK